MWTCAHKCVRAWICYLPEAACTAESVFTSLIEFLLSSLLRNPLSSPAEPLTVAFVAKQPACKASWEFPLKARVRQIHTWGDSGAAGAIKLSLFYHAPEAEKGRKLEQTILHLCSCYPCWVFTHEIQPLHRSDDVSHHALVQEVADGKRSEEQWRPTVRREGRNKSSSVKWKIENWMWSTRLCVCV